MEELEKILETMRKEIKSGEIPAARRALRSFIDHVTVRDDQFAITYPADALTGFFVVPPRGFELTRCTDKNNAGECARTGWLGLAAGGNALAWRERAAEMKTMRDQGQTLAAIGERFGLSAERVRQILVLV